MQTPWRMVSTLPVEAHNAISLADRVRYNPVGCLFFVPASTDGHFLLQHVCRQAYNKYLYACTACFNSHMKKASFAQALNLYVVHHTAGD